MKHIGQYKNGNYSVTIFSDGTKIRENDLDSLEPDFPESIDLSITEKCSQGCDFCYMNCKKDGKEADLLSPSFLDHLHPYTELAINGNDMDHPQLFDFLIKMKEKNVIVNMTVNTKQFIENFTIIKLLVNSQMIYGLGVSYNKEDYTESFAAMLRCFPNAVVHVIAGLITKEELEKLKEFNILILGYKEVGRGVGFHKENQSEIIKNMTLLSKNITKIKSDNPIAFDNLAIKQLKMQEKITKHFWDDHYMGDDGQYTMYIDLVHRKFAKNSCEKKENFMPLLQTADEMLQKLKERK